MDYTKLNRMLKFGAGAGICLMVLAFFLSKWVPVKANAMVLFSIPIREYIIEFTGDDLMFMLPFFMLTCFCLNFFFGGDRLRTGSLKAKTAYIPLMPESGLKALTSLFTFVAVVYAGATIAWMNDKHWWQVAYMLGWIASYSFILMQSPQVGRFYSKAEQRVVVNWYSMQAEFNLILFTWIPSLAFYAVITGNLPNFNLNTGWWILTFVMVAAFLSMWYFNAKQQRQGALSFLQMTRRAGWKTAVVLGIMLPPMYIGVKSIIY